MDMKQYYNYERNAVDRLRAVLDRIAHSPIAGGVLLMLCALISLVWANSSFSESYEALQTTQLTIGIGGGVISKSILFWINDGLMVIFFFVVGLEIKSEVLHGELSSWQKASLPAVAALGGMVVPALAFTAFNAGQPSLSGWGVPMATDIAFAVGILALLGKRVPASLRIFLLALAIVDDLGAIIVIALFYTAHLSLTALALGVLGVGLLFGLNRLGVRSLGVYALLGVLVWVAFLNSGIHPTIAGVLVAFTIPSRPPVSLRHFFSDTAVLLQQSRVLDSSASLSVHRKYNILDTIGKGLYLAESPMRRAEKGLHNWVNFFIMPLFALFNAGVVLSGASLVESLSTPVALGIIAGLCIGKPLGIVLFAWVATKVRVASLPSSLNWKQFTGMAMLGGIGFTMSLFIASLAYDGVIMYLNEAKIGIIAGSLISAIAGLLYLRRVLPSVEQNTVGGESADEGIETFPDILPDKEEYGEETPRH